MSRSMMCLMFVVGWWDWCPLVSSLICYKYSTSVGIHLLYNHKLGRLF